MIDRNLAGSTWISDKGNLAKVTTRGLISLVDNNGYVGEYDHDEIVPEDFGRWQQITEPRQREQYLVLLCGNIDDLPLALFATERDANYYAWNISTGGEERIAEAINAGNQALKRDCSSCVCLAVVKFVDGFATSPGEIYIEEYDCPT